MARLAALLPALVATLMLLLLASSTTFVAAQESAVVRADPDTADVLAWLVQDSLLRQRAAHDTGSGAPHPLAKLATLQAVQRERIVATKIRGLGFPVESFDIDTPDGFILRLHRIPYGRSGPSAPDVVRPVVFLQHGLIDSSYTWIVNGAENSLAFMLADAGYDVWMGNVRGNQYSDRHVSLEGSSDFWEFSYDEHIKYDLPTMLYFVLNATNVDKLHYVAHSQGTLIAFAAFSSDHALSSRVRSMIVMAPVTSVRNLKVHLLRFLANIRLDNFVHLFKKGEFLPSTALENLPGFCKLFSSACEHAICAIAGCSDFDKVDSAVFPQLLKEYPASTSVKNIVHWAQNIRTGTLAAFDYGRAENRKRYGSDKPPVYSLDTLDVPVVAYSGGMDLLSTPEDTELLWKSLPPQTRVFKREFPDFGHSAFVWGLRAGTDLYPELIKWLQYFDAKSA